MQGGGLFSSDPPSTLLNENHPEGSKEMK